MFVIDAMSRVPVYEQIVTQTQDLLLSGVLKPGDSMPSVRGLSVKLGVNPNTIQKAYAELERRGVTVSVPGKGSFLREDAADTARQRVLETGLPKLNILLKDFSKAGLDRADILNLVKRALDEEVDK